MMVYIGFGENNPNSLENVVIIHDYDYYDREERSISVKDTSKLEIILATESESKIHDWFYDFYLDDIDYIAQTKKGAFKILFGDSE